MSAQTDVVLIKYAAMIITMTTGLAVARTGETAIQRVFGIITFLVGLFGMMSALHEAFK